MVKAAAVLALVPAASAFVATAPKMAARGRALKMNYGYEDGGREAGAVQFFPSSKPYWDPLNLSKGGDADLLAKYKAIEIKHGRVAMLAALDYFVRGFGGHFPGSFADTPIESIPVGLAALKALPAAGWAQILVAVSALELAAPQRDGRLPGQVQPETPLFPMPGSIEDQTKEINNGRLAMVSVLGIWVGELLTGGQNPLTTFQPYAPGLNLP